MKYQNTKRNKLRNINKIPYIHHIIMFIFREILFCLIIPLLVYPARITKIGFYVESDVVFLNIFNMFILFLAYKSVVSQKIFTYYVTIIVLLNNGIINFFVLKTSLAVLEMTNPDLITYLISISFIVEALISLYVVYINRFLSWMDVFRKLGANTRIRNAYFYRQILEATLPYIYFISFHHLSNILFPTTINIKTAAIFRGVLIIVCSLQLLFIFVNFNDEDVLQRRIAIGFTFLRLAVLGILLETVVRYRSNIKSDKFYTACIFYGNYVTIQVIIVIILIKDMSLFGSGLKEYLKTNPLPIDLE